MIHPANKRLWISLALMAFAIGLILFGILEMIRDAHSEISGNCVTSKDADQIRELTLSAIDEALKQHVGHLFEIWVKDPSEQPKRAVAGMAYGINAYQRARANALQWNPPEC